MLRLSWSPDGQYLVSAHAMNNSAPTAQIIEREGWKMDKDFVGHRKAITCVVCFLFLFSFSLNPFDLPKLTPFYNSNIWKISRSSIYVDDID